MTDRFTPAWFDEVVAAWSAGPSFGDVSGRIRLEVTGEDGPGPSSYTVVDGRLTAAGPDGPDGSGADGGPPDLTVTVTVDDLDDLLAGRLDPSVAFMQGRLKVEGSMSLLLAVLPVTRTEGYERIRHRIGDAAT